MEPNNNLKIPWEDRQIHGTFYGLYLNVKESLVNPVSYFENLSKTRGYLDPIIYTALITVITYTFAMMLSLLFSDIEKIFGKDILFYSLFLFPLLLLSLLFGLSAIMNLIITWITKEKIDFELALRIVYYSIGPLIFTIIPIVGILIALGWYVYLVIIGIRTIFMLSVPKSAGIVFASLILLIAINLLFFLF